MESYEVTNRKVGITNFTTPKDPNLNIMPLEDKTLVFLSCYPLLIFHKCTVIRIIIIFNYAHKSYT